MFRSEALVTTDRPSRYLMQLCEHLEQIQSRHPGSGLRVEWHETCAEIRLGPGRCEIRALTGALRLRAEADDEATLRDITTRIADRLQTIGRRDAIAVAWIDVPGD